MRQSLSILLRSTRRMALCFNSIVNTPNILKGLHRPMIAWGLVIFCLSPALANDYTLAWDANDEPNVEGYKIYYSVDWPGPPYDGLHPFYPHSDSPIDVGNVTEYTLHDLEEDHDYYFVITAYDSEGNESGFSSQVSTADADDSDEFRSFSSGDSGSGATACFIQSTK